MSALPWILDGVVALLLIGLAYRLLDTRDLFEATVLYIAFGLTLSLAWVRLGAADLALAEAALGAGVTGALFLNAYQRLARRGEGRTDEESSGLTVVDDRVDEVSPAAALASYGVWGLIAGGLAWVLVTLPARDPILPVLVDAALEDAGVSNPITAVLLNFRAYDTLLEIVVLVAAMVGVWSLDRGSREFARNPADLGDEPILGALSRLVVPLAGLTAVYLTWTGAYATGGAFQAGALAAGAGVLLVAAGFMRPVTSAAPFTRALGVLALVVFTVVGLVSLFWTGLFLDYPPGAEYGLILLVEGALTVSIAVILVELFVDVPAIPEDDPGLRVLDPTGDPLGRVISPDGAFIRGAEEE